MSDHSIQSLDDLNKLRSSPVLTNEQTQKLLNELKKEMLGVDWFTIGIMAKSKEKAISVLRSIEIKYGWEQIRIKDIPKDNGPVFLKANQRSGDALIRIEHGLGEGVLMSSHYIDLEKSSSTWGPLPLEAFNN